MIALLLALTIRQQQPPPRADLIITNARVYTVDENRPRVSALAVRDGRVQLVGSDREALALRGPSTHVIDATGHTIIPGMVDAHAHLLGLGLALHSVSLVATKSYDEVVARVTPRVKDVPAGQWILGRGWDQNQWGDTRFPTHEALSRVSPNNPVVLTRVDGHALLANAAAM